MDQVEREVQRRKRILDYAEDTGNVAKTYLYFGIGRTIFSGRRLGKSIMGMRS